MYAVRVYYPKGLYDDYYFRKEENARAFLKKKIEEFIQLQIDKGYESSSFGFNTYEEMLKRCAELHHGMVTVAYMREIIVDD